MSKTGEAGDPIKELNVELKTIEAEGRNNQNSSALSKDKIAELKAAIPEIQKNIDDFKKEYDPLSLKSASLSAQFKLLHDNLKKTLDAEIANVRNVWVNYNKETAEQYGLLDGLQKAVEGTQVSALRVATKEQADKKSCYDQLKVSEIKSLLGQLEKSLSEVEKYAASGTEDRRAYFLLYNLVDRPGILSGDDATPSKTPTMPPAKEGCSPPPPCPPDLVEAFNTIVKIPEEACYPAKLIAAFKALQAASENARCAKQKLADTNADLASKPKEINDRKDKRKDYILKLLEPKKTS